jgi:hypothetical protein
MEQLHPSTLYRQHAIVSHQGDTGVPFPPGTMQQGSRIGGHSMADQHQVNSIIATAICDGRQGPRRRMDPEEADAGLRIVPVGET